MSRLVLPGAALALVLVAACGSSGHLAPTAGKPAQATAAAGSSYYLASTSSWATLLTWNSDGTGTITVDSISSNGNDPSAPYSLSVVTDPIGVTVNGNQVTINVYGTTIPGTINSDGSLTVTPPPSATTGLVQSGTLQPSDPNAYNAAVAALNQTISQDNQQAAAAQQQAQQQQQVSQDQQTAASDTSSLQGDPQTLSSDVSSLDGDVSTASNDLQTLKNDAAQGQGSPCDNLTGSVDPDATGSLAPDLTGSLEPDLNSLANDISTARGDIQKVQADETTLKNDGVSVPASMGQAVSAALQAISSAISKANGDIATEMGYINNGYQIANNLAYGACAGMGPGSPPAPPGNLS